MLHQFYFRSSVLLVVKTRTAPPSCISRCPVAGPGAMFRCAAGRFRAHLPRVRLNPRVAGAVLPLAGFGSFLLDAKVARAESRVKRVAVYGGTFDPPTNSHMICASEIVHSGCADEVWLVPCGRRVDKPELKTPALDRYCMCQIAVNTVFSPEFPIKVSDIDSQREMAAYTYDLLCSLRDAHPDVQFTFIIGSDWLQPDIGIHRWRSRNPAWKPGMPESEKEIVTGDKLLKEFEFLVIPRPGYDVPRTKADPSGLKAFGPRLSWLEMPQDFHFIEGNLSSTEIRKRTKATDCPAGALQSIDGLIPLGVLSYIRRHELYYKSKQ